MYKTIIIDDELGARKVISAIIKNYTTDFEILAEAESVLSGVNLLLKHKPDVVMLDINLQDGTGFDLLKQLPNVNFKLIFITAYDEFAIQAIKFNAFDYILKPIDAEELINSLKKVKDEFNQKINPTQLQYLVESYKTGALHKKTIILKTAESIHIINTKDIIYCKSDNNYTEFHIQNTKMILVSNTLKYYEKLLSGQDFIRCHQSYLVNINHLKSYEKRDGGFLALSNNDQIPVSTSKKHLVFSTIEKL